MTIMNTLGRAAGTSAAYLVEGSRLGATSFAQGAKVGYVAKATELKAKRLELAGQAPAVTRQRKLAVTKA